jgi:hypothetical protein
MNSASKLKLLVKFRNGFSCGNQCTRNKNLGTIGTTGAT